MSVRAMLPPHRLSETPLDEDPVPEREAPEPRRPATLLPRTIKLCLVLGLVALGAAQYLARAVERGPLRQHEARAVLIDPETTGSIGTAAAHTTLAPCTAPGLRR